MKIDIAGEKFGRLTAIKTDGKRQDWKKFIDIAVIIPEINPITLKA